MHDQLNLTSMMLPPSLTSPQCIDLSLPEILRSVQEAESQEPQGIRLLVNNADVARDDKNQYSHGVHDFAVSNV